MFSANEVKMGILFKNRDAKLRRLFGVYFLYEELNPHGKQEQGAATRKRKPFSASLPALAARASPFL